MGGRAARGGDPLSRCRILALPVRESDRGLLFPVGLSDLPFTPQSWFWVTGVPNGRERGGHAHRKAEQVLVCLRGLITVWSWGEDGKGDAIRLPGNDTMLYVPANTWVLVRFSSSDSLLFAFSSREYEESDYVRNPTEFFRSGRLPPSYRS